MEFSKLCRIMEADSSFALGANNPANNQANLSSPKEPSSIDSQQFDLSHVRRALQNVEKINGDEKGKYTRLIQHIKNKPGMMQLFGELINTLAGVSAATGQRMTRPLNQ